MPFLETERSLPSRTFLVLGLLLALLASLVRLAPHPIVAFDAQIGSHSLSKVREFALDHAALGPGRMGTCAFCAVCACARPHGPDTLNTGQGNIRSVMSQTGYYSVDGGVWRFQGMPRYLPEQYGTA